MKRGDISLNKKLAFVNKYAAQTKDAYVCEQKMGSCWPCQNLAEKARKELGYSPKTNAVDILQGLRCAWKRRP